MKSHKKDTKTPRHIFTCAVTRDKIDIAKTNTVKIAGHNQDGKKFVTYAKMSEFFGRFANHKDVPSPLPGLRPYRSKKFPRVRFLFDPSRFGESVQSWAPCKIFNDLLK